MAHPIIHLSPGSSPFIVLLNGPLIGTTWALLSSFLFFLLTPSLSLSLSLSLRFLNTPDSVIITSVVDWWSKVSNTSSSSEIHGHFFAASFLFSFFFYFSLLLLFFFLPFSLYWNKYLYFAFWWNNLDGRRIDWIWAGLFIYYFITIILFLFLFCCSIHSSIWGGFSSGVFCSVLRLFIPLTSRSGRHFQDSSLKLNRC